MANALESAFTRAETMRASARAVVASRASRLPGTYGYGPVANNAQQAFNNENVPWAWAEQGQNHEQLRHFKDWVYVCVNAIANRVAAQPIVVGNLNARRRQIRQHNTIAPLESHRFLDVVHAPNQLMAGGWALMYTTVASLKLTGKAYWWMPGDGMPDQIWPIPPSWVVPVDRFRSVYQINPINESIAPFRVPGERLAFFNFPHPIDPWLSASPLASQAAAVNADEALQQAQADMFENGMFPALGITTGDVTDLDDQERLPLLDDDQRNIVYDALRKMFQGRGKYGAWIIFDALIKGVEKLSLTPEEMGFLESGQITKSRIFQAYGVNPLVVGEIQGANRAQATVAEEAFCSNVINPLVTLLSQVLTRRVAPLFAQDKEKLAIWIEPARAHDPDLKLQEWELGLKTNAVDRNEYRTAVLGLQPKPGYDKLLIPMNVVPDDE